MRTGGMARTTYTAETRVLATLLRSVREQAGLRQADLAEALDRPQSWVSDYEAGQRRLDLVELRSICRACGITLRQFVNRFERAIADG
jgi:transcriptional regulator with XRE-family HTH domain